VDSDIRGGTSLDKVDVDYCKSTHIRHILSTYDLLYNLTTHTHIHMQTNK